LAASLRLGSALRPAGSGPVGRPDQVKSQLVV